MQEGIGKVLQLVQSLKLRLNNTSHTAVSPNLSPDFKKVFKNHRVFF